MGGIAGQITGQILRITDIGIEIGKQCHLGFRSTGEMQSGPHHEGKQPDDFERDGLPSRIRPGNHKDTNLLVHENVVRDDIIFRDEQQRMPRLRKHHTTVLVQDNGMTL